MKLDFLEIGTSDFDTLCQSSLGSGMVIEPIKYYIDRLPSRDNLIKLNIAISPCDCETTVDMYYIPPDVIADKGLPDWLKGCNSINRPHPQHSVYPYYVKDTVQSRPLFKVLEENQVEGIEHLKIDTEGCDTDILFNYYHYLYNKPTSHRPRTITFETAHASESDIGETLELYTGFGYKIHKNTGTDIVLKWTKI